MCCGATGDETDAAGCDDRVLEVQAERSHELLRETFAVGKRLRPPDDDGQEAVVGAAGQVGVGQPCPELP